MNDTSFLDEVENAIMLYEKVIRHTATHTRMMIEQHGEVEALSRLMISADLQQ